MIRPIEICALLLGLCAAAPAAALGAQASPSPANVPQVEVVAPVNDPSSPQPAAPTAERSDTASSEPQTVTAATETVASAGELPAGEDPTAEPLLWTAGALQSLLVERDYATVLLLAAANHVAAEAPDGMAGDGVRSLVTALSSGPARDRLRQCRAADDSIDNALCSLETLASAAPAGVARWLTYAGASLVGDAFRARPRSGIAGIGAPGVDATYAVSEPLQRFAEPVLEQAWRLATSGGSSSFREFVRDAVGLDPSAGLEALITAPELSHLLGLQPALSRLSEGETALRDVVAHYHGMVDSSARTLGGILATFTDPDRDPVDRLTGALDRRLEWAADRSLAYLASRAAELTGGDDGAVARIRAVGSAIADLKLGVGSFSEQLATLGQQAATASLAGNVLSVAMGVTSFFGITPGALGPASARDVRALRAAVDTIRAEMLDRFDTIDASLDTVLLAVDSGFERLERLTIAGNADVQEQLAGLTREFATLGHRLERMETNLLAYMQDGFSRDYNRTLVRCLEHRERHLPPYDEMEFQVFSQCLAEFRTRAVQDSRDALLTDQTTPVDDASLAAALAGGDDSLDNLGRRLALLGRAAQERFGYAAMRGGRAVANPVEWAVAAQAYLTLLHDWPQHASAITSGDLEAILAVGRDLDTVLEAITRDPNGTGRSPILAALDAYRTSAADLANEADVLARRHQQAGLLRVSPDSVLQWIFPGDVDAEQAAGDALSLPAHLAALVPEEVRTAAVLGLGEPTLTYRIESQDSTVRQDFRRRFLIFGKRHDRLTFSRSTVEIELGYGTNGTIVRFAAEGPFVLRRTETINGGETSENVKSTVEHVPDVRAHFLQRLWPAIADDADSWTVSASDAWTLAAIGGRIEAELRRHATAALNDVFAVVCGIGAERGLQAADAVSASRMSAVLDAMTAARGLVEAYLRLGLPESTATNAQLRAALFGPQAILDRTALCDAVRAGDSPLRLVWIGDGVSSRAAALKAALDAIFAQPDFSPEPLPLVGHTIRQLEDAIRLQRLRTRVAQAGL